MFEDVLESDGNDSNKKEAVDRAFPKGKGMVSNGSKDSYSKDSKHK
jgi:hypothetical protein